MEFPKFLLGDNTDYHSAIFIVHTQYPRFIINLENDEVEWLEDFTKEDEKELESEAENLIEEASAFYDREVSRYQE
ncbi:3-hydroxybutyryl-CoA dehydrogenase [hydrothermal vent metagenome]|uniref:3-hydroxybutyryl-CoA dehydrogenase n=1 Tax=hydrothermal vent metagenome TaxID=652676 RepID=A0A3B0TCR7_9ZZZZ